MSETRVNEVLEKGLRDEYYTTSKDLYYASRHHKKEADLVTSYKRKLGDLDSLFSKLFGAAKGPLLGYVPKPLNLSEQKEKNTSKELIQALEKSKKLKFENAVKYLTSKKLLITLAFVRIDFYRCEIKTSKTEISAKSKNSLEEAFRRATDYLVRRLREQKDPFHLTESVESKRCAKAGEFFRLLYEHLEFGNLSMTMSKSMPAIEYRWEFIENGKYFISKWYLLFSDIFAFRSLEDLAYCVAKQWKRSVSKMKKLTVTQLMKHGKAMIENGWSVSFNSSLEHIHENYIWESPRGDTYGSQTMNVPSEEAVKDAVINEDYQVTIQ